MLNTFHYGIICLQTPELRSLRDGTICGGGTSSSLPRWSHLPSLVPSSSVGRSLCEAERQRDEILREASGGSGSRGERGSAVKPPDSWNRLVHSGRGAADARLRGRPLCRGLRPGRRRGRGGGACAAGSSGHGLFLCPTSLRPFVFFLGGRRGAAISGPPSRPFCCASA